MSSDLLICFLYLNRRRRRSRRRGRRGVWAFMLFNDAWSQKGYLACTRRRRRRRRSDQAAQQLEKDTWIQWGGGGGGDFWACILVHYFYWKMQKIWVEGTLSGDKVSMLTHRYPYKPMRKIWEAIRNHKADCLLYMCHLLGNVVHDAEYPHWDQVSLNINSNLDSSVGWSVLQTSL